MTDNKDIWITTGYDSFARLGINGLKVETLSKTVGISKSSFYHHFTDVEIFTEYLLKHHIEQSVIIGEKELQAKTIDPDLITILADHKTDLLVNRQLRINRNIKLFDETLAQANKAVGNGFVMLWVKDLNLQMNQKQLEAFFELAIENFYLQINADNLNQQWLSGYFTNLKRIARKFV